MKLNREVAQEIREIIERPALEDYVWVGLIGVRFDKVPYEIGSVLPESKAFFPTEDSDVREFPAYSSEEYNELPGMGGTSTWSINEILRLLERNPNGCDFVIGATSVFLCSCPVHRVLRFEYKQIQHWLTAQQHEPTQH